MAFNRRLDSTFPGFGVSVRNDSAYLSAGNSITTSGSPNTVTLPSSGTWSVGTTVGKGRIKIYNAATSPVLTVLKVSFSDGTNTVFLPGVFPYPTGLPVVSSTNWYEIYFDYLLDVATTSSGAGGAYGQLLPGGATSMSVVSTITGSGASLSMDVEICPLI